jgi:lipoate-protein ligase A
MAGDRKIVASAQKRLGTALLQHGSIKIGGVVSHPALAGIGDRLESCTQAIDTKAFKKYGELFRTAMGRSLGLVFLPCDLTEAEMREIDRRTAQVEKNALSKRVIVAQNDGAASL